MSYPFIGIQGLDLVAATPTSNPAETVWDAAQIEKMMRDSGSGVGIHIFFEEGEHLEEAWFKDGKFQYVTYAQVDISSDQEARVLYETEDFKEFAVWVAFFGRDFL